MTHVLWTAGLFVGSLSVVGCCTVIPEATGTPAFLSGLNEVRLVPAGSAQVNDHPVRLTPTEAGTLLHRMLYREQRNAVHQLISGPAPLRRIFRNDEIALLAPVLAQILAEARPDQMVFFHLSRPGSGGPEQGTSPLQTGMPGVAMGRPLRLGGEESTTGWIFVRGPWLYVLMREIQQVHKPEPDINKFIREMPNVPEPEMPFEMTFDPELYEAEAERECWRVGRRLEVLAVDFRQALRDVPPYRSLETGTPPSP
jgi:hypothetical protein